jgi:hypothetical protein
MQAASWMELLERIPEHQRNKLVVMTDARVEIAVQDLVRMSDDYIAVRGRLAGSSDTGRLFFIPFNRIVYVGLQKLVIDQEIAEIFGTAPPKPAPTPVAVAEEPPKGEPKVEEPSSPEPEPPAEVEGLRGTSNLTPTVMPNRNELLERIRSRSKGATGLRPPKP